MLAYFEIGAIEEYRPEWSQVPADLKLGPVDGWPDEQYVKYWDERWWPIVQGRIDRALAAGFTGCYLDMVVTYEEIPANAARVRAAGKLVLSTDYAVQAAHVADAYTRSRAAGFVPYVSVRALDRMTVNAGWDPR